MRSLLLILLLAVITTLCSCSNASPDYDTDQVTQMYVSSLTMSDTLKKEYELVLRGTHDTMAYLKMGIGDYEAQMLTIAIRKQTTAAPLPLDLFKNGIEKLGYSVQSVLINGMNAYVYTSEIMYAKGNDIMTIEARASDAVTVAVKSKALIYVAKDLLEAMKYQQ